MGNKNNSQMRRLAGFKVSLAESKLKVNVMQGYFIVHHVALICTEPNELHLSFCLSHSIFLKSVNELVFVQICNILFGMGNQ